MSGPCDCGAEDCPKCNPGCNEPKGDYGREVYRTWDYYDTKEGALERTDAWFKESMEGGNLEALFKQILGTSNPSSDDRQNGQGGKHE